MSNCKSSFSGHTVVLSLLVGAIAGAAAVLLLAPKARRESAERIRGFSHDLRERASDTMDFLDEKRSVISSAVEAGKEAYGRRKAQVPSGE